MKLFPVTHHVMCVYFIAISVCLTSCLTGAATSVLETSRYDQRAKYQQALIAISNGQLTRFRKLKSELDGYPLLPYLEFRERSRRISRESATTINAFADTYHDSPLADQLRRRWLTSLASRTRWDDLIDAYDQRLASKEVACRHGWALYKSGQTEAAWSMAKTLFLVDYSQPEECDPLFKAWRVAGQLGPLTAWNRFVITLEGGNVDLASYLVRFVAPSDQATANIMRDLHVRPRRVEKTSRFKLDTEHQQYAVLHGIRRLARRDAAAALNALKALVDRTEFVTPLDATYVYIAKRLLRDGDDGGHVDSLPIDLRRFPGLIESKLRLALREGNFQRVLALIEQLPVDLAESNRWRYWKARAHALSDTAANQTLARTLFRELAGERTFYGFVSADRLGLSYDYSDAPKTFSDDEIKAIERVPGIQRALELFALGDLAAARREWRFTLARFDPTNRQIAARVATRWGWHKRAIQAMIDAEAWNDLAPRFPLAFFDDFARRAREQALPTDFPIAVARQESAFMPDARSSAGALGLMQLMPRTARITADKFKISYRSVNQLVQPRLNIELGTSYLGQMMRAFHNNRILAAAAYNAGPSRVRRWLDPSLEFDVWIEVIPFGETRSYVQNVLMFSMIFARRMDMPRSLLFKHELAYFNQPEAPPEVSGQ